MAIKAWKDYPRSVSVLRSTGIERIAAYHPIKQPIPNMTYIDEFITDHCGGVYLKWLNKKAGYDYWLFNPQFEKILKTKDLGNILSVDPNRARALSATHNIGKEATISYRVTTKVSKEMGNILEYVLISPEVYLFQPESLFGSVSCSEFVKVFVRPGSFTIEKGNANNVKLKFTIELDPKNVQTLI